MLNHIDIMGRLTADPELRSTNGGTQVATFTVACERDFGEKDKKETDFIECVAWKQTGEFISKYFKKGSLIAVSGALQSRKWEDKTGNKRVSWAVNVDRAYFAGAKPEAPAKLTELPDDDGQLPF